jgi:hypothetical protein
LYLNRFELKFSRVAQNSINKFILTVYISEVGHVLYSCENDIVCSTTCGKIPFFNAPIFFENKEQIGKLDEIFGSPQENVSSHIGNLIIAFRALPSN